jgi:bifunctional DNA-binding transcriptional regulator/antitoxin component of YhaV-PrlF toxin-antitoxin module
MMSGKRDKVGINKDDVLEVVDDGFAVEEVVCHDEEVPV